MNPNKKKQLRNLLTTLKQGFEPLESTDQLESGIKQLTGKLQKQMSAKSLDEVNKVLADFQKKIDLTPIKKGLEDLKGSNGGIYEDLRKKIDTFFASFSGRLESGLKRLDSEQTASLSNKDGLTRLEGDFKGKSTLLDEVKGSSEATKKELTSIAEELRGFVKDLNKRLLEQSLNGEQLEGGLETLSDELTKLRQDMLSMIANVGGGNANRNIAIGGNTSVLSMFTDINWKPGSGITITYTNNQVTKYTDITIAANGGTTGITREINTIAVSSVVGSVAGIDYVTLASEGIKVTLPSPVSNLNQYTIKNISNSSVLIVGAGGETIDDETEIIMPVKYTALELISDNTNWKIT